MNKRLLALGLVVVIVIIGLMLYVRQQNQLATAVPQPELATTTPISSVQAIDFKVLDEGLRAPGAKNRKNYAIYDPTELTSFWKIAHGDDGSKPPHVDFSKSYVIAVFAGTKPTNGYHISVAHVKEDTTGRTVDVLISEPGDGCTTASEKTSPYQFILVPYGSESMLEHNDAVVKMPCK